MGRKILGYSVQHRASGSTALELLLKDGATLVLDEASDERLSLYHIKALLESSDNVYIAGVSGPDADLSLANFYTKRRKSPTIKEALRYEWFALKSRLGHGQKRTHMTF